MDIILIIEVLEHIRNYKSFSKRNYKNIKKEWGFNFHKFPIFVPLSLE